MKKIMLLLGVLLLFASCEEKRIEKIQEEDTALYYSEAAAAPKRMMGAGDIVQQNDIGNKIIRRASLQYEVTELDSAVSRIGRLIVQYEGYVQNENQYQRADRLYYTLQIRIPAKRFDDFLDMILIGDDIRRLEEKNVSTSDVSEQFIDVEARLETQRQALKRYRTLLEKAETVSDMIAVEENIRRLEAEITSQEQRLEYLSRQVEMSEIRISVYQILPQKFIPDKGNAFGPQILRSLHAGWRGVIAVFFWMIRLWPIWLLLLLLLIRMKSSQKRDE